MIRGQLQGQVTVAEVFNEDGGQGFIYMALIEGVDLLDRWSALSEKERQAVCRELKHAVKAWRALKQDKSDQFIGSVGAQPL